MARNFHGLQFCIHVYNRNRMYVCKLRRTHWVEIIYEGSFMFFCFILPPCRASRVSSRIWKIMVNIFKSSKVSSDRKYLYWFYTFFMMILWMNFRTIFWNLILKILWMMFWTIYLDNFLDDSDFIRNFEHFNMF